MNTSVTSNSLVTRGWYGFKDITRVQVSTLHSPLTQGRLKHAAVLLAVTHRMNLIVAVHQSPEVILVVRAIQAQAETWP